MSDFTRSEDDQNDVVDNEEVWRWVRFQTRYQTPYIHFAFRSKIWKNIGYRLQAVGGEELRERFGSGCFGQFLEWRELQASGRVTHAIVARQIILEGSSTDELWFRVMGQNLRFSCREYALVTGLRFGTSDFNPNGWHDPTRTGVYRRFGGKIKASVRELYDLFLKGVDGATEDDYLKVANLVALYMFFLGYDSSKVIEDFAWVLVDDLDAWNGFPWGAYTYQALKHYVFSVCRTNEECGDMYHFFGPVWALQMWAFEAIPDLVPLAAIEDRPGRMPRCLRWAFRNPKTKQMNRYFNRNLKRRCLRSLTPDASEEIQEYWISANVSNPFGVSYLEPFNRTTAHLQIDGPIRKAKLEKRRMELDTTKDAAYKERAKACLERNWGKRVARFTSALGSSIENTFKEGLRTETKKLVSRAWDRSIRSIVPSQVSGVVNRRRSVRMVRDAMNKHRRTIFPQDSCEEEYNNVRARPSSIK